MALTGLALAGFVLVHMTGNLQMFMGPEAINQYAHFLQTLPPAVLWGFRIGLLLAAGVHVWMAILLTLENRRARPEKYRKDDTVQASIGSRTMPFTGSILLVFIVFHIFHYTVRTVYDYDALPSFILANGEPVFDVYAMMISGFSHLWVSGFYIFSMALLCPHMAHGVSSMFQSLGLRNAFWRKILDKVALAYGWVIFLGFISIPVAVQGGFLKDGALVSAGQMQTAVITVDTTQVITHSHYEAGSQNS